ncbi:MAG: type II toxin-antitoxin system VapC family toxin [Actinomycetota bacterium]|nr:type II toxin-antitoxin system VapC family toxin [Actinomycetota bacterium]
MRLVDLNLLLYALDETSPHHGRARDWVEEAMSGPETLALAWSVLLGFVRLSTRAAVFEHPLPVDDALDLVDDWLAQPATTVVHPTQRHGAILRSLLQPLGTAGNLTTDAHLAALAIEHGAELCSSDADFSRFPGVRWTDPLRR